MPSAMMMSQRGPLLSYIIDQTVAPRQACALSVRLHVGVAFQVQTQ